MSRARAETSRHGGLRTVDVARRVGCSVQHLRNLERDGVVPVAARTSSGHRSWGELHVLSAVAYRELTAGVGPTPAKELLRALHRQPPAVFLALLDDAHADLARERRTLRLAREAAAAIAAEPLAAPRPSDAMTISELAGALGTTPATLRHWEAEQLLAPQRAGRGHIRTYSPVQVRDARVIHQLRTAGYRIPQLRTVLHTFLNPQNTDAALESGLKVRDGQLTNRSHALLRASAALRDVLAATNQVDGADEPRDGAP
jgi:DNA-binding transcriptional MerR regulator